MTMDLNPKGKRSVRKVGKKKKKKVDNPNEARCEGEARDEHK
jgi:hypothetical protein